MQSKKKSVGEQKAVFRVKFNSRITKPCQCSFYHSLHNLPLCKLAALKVPVAFSPDFTLPAVTAVDTAHPQERTQNRGEMSLFP